MFTTYQYKASIRFSKNSKSKVRVPIKIPKGSFILSTAFFVKAQVEIDGWWCAKYIDGLDEIITLSGETEQGTKGFITTDLQLLRTLASTLNEDSDFERIQKFLREFKTPKMRVTKQQTNIEVSSGKGDSFRGGEIVFSVTFKNAQEFKPKVRKLSEKQKDVIAFLEKDKKWVSATEIGMACGRSYPSASSWACAIMRPLLKSGVIKKEKSKYKINGKV